MAIICSRCGSISKRAAKRGSLAVEVLLWLFFLVPGIIYTIWWRVRVCPVCGSQKVFPASSPIGKKLQRDLVRPATSGEGFFEAACPCCRALHAIFPDDPDRLNCTCGAVLGVERSGTVGTLTLMKTAE
jgi:ribosomal protein S27E